MPTTSPAIRTGLYVAVAVELIVTVAATWVCAASAGRIGEVSDVEPGRSALVLGSLVDDGVPGDYLRGRLDTAVALWRAHKVRTLLLSGNGSPDAGDEPAVMRDYLLRRGVPPAALIEDPRGVTTEASCRRARDVYGLTTVTVVTQDFHLGRAIALCRLYGVDAVGVPASCGCPVVTVIRNHLREPLLANPRALLTAVSVASGTG